MSGAARSCTQVDEPDKPMTEAVTGLGKIAGLGTPQDNNTQSSSQPTPIVVPVEPSPPDSQQAQQNGSLGVQQQLFSPDNEQLLALVKQVQQGLVASLPGFADGNQTLLSSFGQEGTASETGERKRRRNGSSGVCSPPRHGEPANVAEKRRRKQEPQSQPLAAANDDGWQWRKYGEKVVRETPNPRSYYKCSDTSCPARKTVEVDRDGNMINTEYKGEHNHDQPTLARAVPRAGSRQPRAKKQAPQATQDGYPSNASTATDVSRTLSHSPSGAVAGAPATAKDESHTSPLKAQRRPNPASKGTRRQQQQHQQHQQEQEQQGQQGQEQPSTRSAPYRAPIDPASSVSALGSATHLVPVEGDLQGLLRAAGLHVSGPTGTAAAGGAGSMLVGADLSNWLKRTGQGPGSGNIAASAAGGLVGLDDLSGWLKQQQQGVSAGRKGGADRARAQEGGGASGGGQFQPGAQQQQQQQQQQQCTPIAGCRQLGGPFAQALDSSAALGSPPALLRTVPRHLHADDGLHDPIRALQGLSALCSPPTLLSGSAPEPLQPPLPLHSAATADGGNGSCGASTAHMGLDMLHQSLAGGGPLGSASGYLGGGWGGLGSPPTLEGLGSMLKTGGGFMGSAEPGSLHSLLYGATSPAAFPSSAFRSRSNLHASVFSPAHHCDLAAFNSPHPGLPASTPFAPHHAPSRLGEPGRASTIADAGASALRNTQQPQQSQQSGSQQAQQQGQQQQVPGVEDAEGEAQPVGLAGLCSTPCMHGLLPCSTPGTLLPGSSCCYGGLDGGSLHPHALASPPSCLPGSSSRAAAVAVGACDNPWGAVLMGALCSPGGGLAPPPTIPRSHGKGAYARDTAAATDGTPAGGSDAAQLPLSSRDGAAGTGADGGAAAGEAMRTGSDGLTVRSARCGEGEGERATAGSGDHPHSTAAALHILEGGAAAAAATADDNGAAGASAVEANQGYQQQHQAGTEPTAADAADTATLPEGIRSVPQSASSRQGGGARSRARANGTRDRVPPRNAATQHSQQQRQQQQQQQQQVPSSLAAVMAGPTGPPCRSPRLDMLAVCAGLAGEASDQPTDPAPLHHDMHAPATSHTTNSTITQPACGPSAPTSSDGTTGVASAQGVQASHALAAVGPTNGTLDGGVGARLTRVGTRAQQQQQQQQQQQHEQQQQRGKKRAHTSEEGQATGVPVVRDTRAAAAGKHKPAKTTAAEKHEKQADQAHQTAPPAAAQQGLANFTIGDGFAMIKLGGPAQKGPISMPEGDGFVSIRLEGGPQAGKGGECGGTKEACSPLKAAPAAAPPLNGSDAAVWDGLVGAQHRPKTLATAPTAAASLPVCDGSEAGRSEGAATGGGEGGGAAVKAQLADAFGQVATEEAGPGSNSRGSNTQRGSRRRKALS